MTSDVYLVSHDGLREEMPLVYTVASVQILLHVQKCKIKTDHTLGSSIALS